MPLTPQILAHNAVHAAFAGYTGITMGLVNTHYVYLPIPVVIQSPRRVCFLPVILNMN
jgi:6-phosphofructokinase 1